MNRLEAEADSVDGLVSSIERRDHFAQMWLEEYGDKLPSPAREKYVRFLINDNQASGNRQEES